MADNLDAWDTILMTWLTWDGMDAREMIWMTYSTSRVVLVFWFSPALGTEGEDVSLPILPVQLHLFGQLPPTANVWGGGG